MRHILVVVLFALALGLVPTAGATHSPAGSAPRDIITGAGWPGAGCPVPPFFCLPAGSHFSVSAVAGPTGGAAVGHYTQQDNFWPHRGTLDVVCADAVARNGVVAMQIPGQIVATYLIRWFTDGGPHGTDMTSPTFLYQAGFPPGNVAIPPDFPVTCPPPVHPFTVLPLERGNIVVHDGA